MKKSLILLGLAVIILVLWSFNSSFIHSSVTASATGSSTVIFAKTDSVSARVQFIVTPQAGSTVNITLPDGSIVKDSTTYHFEVLLPKNSSGEIFPVTTLGDIQLSPQNPCGAAVVPNANDTTNTSAIGATVYLFNVEGTARVTIAWFGVGV